MSEDGLLSMEEQERIVEDAWLFVQQVQEYLKEEEEKWNLIHYNLKHIHKTVKRKSDETESIIGNA